MARIDSYLEAGLKALRPRPADGASQGDKKRYSEQVSAAVAIVAERNPDFYEIQDGGLVALNRRRMGKGQPASDHGDEDAGDDDSEE